MSTRYPLFLARTWQLPKVWVKVWGRVLAPILERMTIWKEAFSAITAGAWVIRAFTVAMPALTGGFERTQLNVESATGS